MRPGLVTLRRLTVPATRPCRSRGSGVRSPHPQYIQFTAVEPVGPETINANGQGQVDGMEPYPVGPIPFVRYNNEWKLSRAFVCGGLFLAVPQVCD